MKKIMMIVMVLLGVNLFSLDHGVISGFEIGYNLQEILMVGDKVIYNNEDSISVKLQTGYRIGQLRLLGTYTNTMKQREIDAYMPLQDRFRIDVNYTFKGFTIGFFHWCDHPVVSQADDRTDLVNRGQRSVYIRYYREF